METYHGSPLFLLGYLDFLSERNREEQSGWVVLGGEPSPGTHHMLLYTVARCNPPPLSLHLPVLQIGKPRPAKWPNRDVNLESL